MDLKMNCCACQCAEAKDSDILPQKETTTPGIYFVHSGKSIQHPVKASTRSINADAFAADTNIIGIADGVSTVEDEGLDPSELPVELLANCIQECKARERNSLLFDAEAEDLLSSCDVELYSYTFPLYVMTKASVQCTTYGSTTCVLAILENDRLWSANIGDSQLLVVRRTETPPKAYPRAQDFSYSTCHDSRGRVSNHEDYGGYQIVYRTAPQQHFFNCPYQFSRMPDIDCSEEAIIRRTAQTVEVGSVEVQPGDIVILGTDGLFDNVFDDDLLELLNRMCWPDSEPLKPPKTDPSGIVDALLDIAVKAGQPPPGETIPIITPFSKAAFDEVGHKIVGGKPDDITVVVAYVLSGSGSADLRESERGCRSHERLLSRGTPEQVKLQPTGLKTIRAQDYNGESAKSTSSQESHLSVLGGFDTSRLPLSMPWVSRASFPPRLQGVTTPAIKASVHAVPKALQPTEYVAFENLKEKAKQRLQIVVSAGPPLRTSDGDSTLPAKTVTIFESLRRLFSRE